VDFIGTWSDWLVWKVLRIGFCRMGTHENELFLKFLLCV
jgi:hypothetical protein